MNIFTIIQFILGLVMWALIFIGLGTFFGWNQMKSLKIGFAVYFILIFLVAIYFYTMDTGCYIIYDEDLSIDTRKYPDLFYNPNF